MIDYKKYFKNKKITIMGLGLLGRGVGYTKFLAECGALLTVTDLKTKEQLASSVKELRKYKNIKYVLGKHRLEDFKNKDMIIKSAGVPLDSIYIKEAKENKIPVEMDASLFTQLVPEVRIIGVTGTRGKTMTTMLVYEILKANQKLLKRKVYVGGNVRGGATLPLLSKVKKGDIVVLELDSWQLQGFGEAKLSPQISVFTSFMSDHMNYYKDNMKKYFADKANIFKYQKKGDVLVIRPDMKKLIPKSIKSKLIVVKVKDVDEYDFIVPGTHQRENLACAVKVVKLFKIPDVAIKKAVKNFKGVEGRLQYVKTVKGIKIYNDNNATTPEATISGLEALEGKNNIILIAGGADKGLDTEGLEKAINKHCKKVVLLTGTGTDKIIKKNKFKVPIMMASSLKDAIKSAQYGAKKDDILLFSPAFASFGMFTNEYDRNDQFMKIIKKLK
ncbi:MAG: UDP-N-acetylmuramoyl-L-alanine--D-glutamate ligase [Patescibacteria group bacterium]